MDKILEFKNNPNKNTFWNLNSDYKNFFMMYVNI